MVKYEKLMKGLEMCAGPDCCKDACPYYGETRGGKTCRAWLLADAAAAISNEQLLRESAEEGYRNADEEAGKLNAAVDDLEAANATVRAERDSLANENRIMRERCQVQQNEINALLRKTDRPSVDNDTLENLACEVERYRAEAAYARGKADTLKWFICEYFREGGFQE